MPEVRARPNVFGTEDRKEIESGGKAGKFYFAAGTEILVRAVPL